MTVSLRGTTAPIRDVSNLGYAAVAVYSLLFESAYKEHKFHKPGNSAPYITAGTTHWSHKAIAQTLHMGKATLIKALDKLLDHGFLTVVGYASPPFGSVHRIYRVIHPELIEHQRHALEVIGVPSSVRQKSRDALARETFFDSYEKECEGRVEHDEEFVFYREVNNAQKKSPLLPVSESKD